MGATVFFFPWEWARVADMVSRLLYKCQTLVGAWG